MQKSSFAAIYAIHDNIYYFLLDRVTDKKFHLFGGKAEGMESFQTCLMRELNEELDEIHSIFDLYKRIESCKLIHHSVMNGFDQAIWDLEMDYRSFYDIAKANGRISDYVACHKDHLVSFWNELPESTLKGAVAMLCNKLQSEEVKKATKREFEKSKNIRRVYGVNYVASMALLESIVYSCDILPANYGKKCPLVMESEDILSSLGQEFHGILIVTGDDMLLGDEN